MIKISFFLCLCILFFSFLQAQSRKAVDISTDILMFANSATGFVGSLIAKDYTGTKQVVIGGVGSLAATYILKYSIRKERPDHSDHHSFPSTHTSMAFQGATFLQRRYGWKYGVPAYALSVYVGWGRIYAQKHDFSDVATGAAIGLLSSYIFTRPFARKHNLTLIPATIQKYPGFYAYFTF